MENCERGFQLFANLQNPLEMFSWCGWKVSHEKDIFNFLREIDFRARQKQVNSTSMNCGLSKTSKDESLESMTRVCIEGNQVWVSGFSQTQQSINRFGIRWRFVVNDVDFFIIDTNLKLFKGLLDQLARIQAESLLGRNIKSEIEVRFIPGDNKTDLDVWCCTDQLLKKLVHSSYSVFILVEWFIRP